MKETFYWLALNSIPGVGRATLKALIERYDSPKRVFEISVDELQGAGVPLKVAKQINHFRAKSAVEKELTRIKADGVGLITLTDKRYPQNLLQIYDPPSYLYIKGELKEEDRRAVAVVGARAATPYGIEVTKKICRVLASQGITIVSGMARGVDTAAHIGAMEGGGRTIAVLGSGINVIYPRENLSLFKTITAKGAVISEFPMATPPFSQNFPLRNRIISGLSLGTVVVEASIKSGSLITARLALEQGREVFAIPGSIMSHRSRGTNRLIKEGAKLVEDTNDILEELIPQIEGIKRTGMGHTDEVPEVTLGPEEDRIWKILNDEPKHIDTIIQESQLNSSKVSVHLLNMEMKGLIKEHPGKYYTRSFEGVAKN